MKFFSQQRPAKRQRMSDRQLRARTLRCETLERRALMSADLAGGVNPMDVNSDGEVSARDALAIINHLNSAGLTAGSESVGSSILSGSSTSSDASSSFDINRDGHVTAVDALQIINSLNALPNPSSTDVDSVMGEDVFDGQKAPGVGVLFDAPFSEKDAVDNNMNDPEKKDTILNANQLTEEEVKKLLQRASMATKSNDAIIAVVDRSGRILGVRVEEGVSSELRNNHSQFAFAIDGAVAKARTAAFFSSNEAPLTSRTIRFISQSTVTQREVESSPTNGNELYRGPGFVAPIGVGGHFPPEIPFTPQVDLFAIEHQSRDSQTHPGPDGIKSIDGDDFELMTRFNADPQYIPANAEDFFQTWPESFGEQSGMDEFATPRGIATLPGGVPLYKDRVDKDGNPVTSPVSEALNLVGGIGVFFPGEYGFATHEQGFEHGVGQTERARTNADRVLEAEYAALIASSGRNIFSLMSGFSRDISAINATLPYLKNYVALNGRIDLVGITLEIYGPTPSREFRMPGIDRLLQYGNSLGQGEDSGENVKVDSMHEVLSGQPVPHGWLVAPHDSPTDSGLTAADVQQIIETGVEQAERTRAAIRLNIDAGFRPGATTGMVLSVADTNGELLGLFRMEDATIFSIDVSVAKARNTAYYADEFDLQQADMVDFNGDGLNGQVATSLDQSNGDTLPRGTALTSRSFRFLAEPRFPTGTELDAVFDQGCAANPTPCLEVGPHSMLRLPGIHPNTGENLGDGTPMAFDVYASPTHSSTKAFDAFNVMRNFRDPGDTEVVVYGSKETLRPEQRMLANQNGVVFFPGSTALYASAGRTLIGGFGVSGDGVDQDDVVTFAGQEGYAPDPSIRVDAYTIGGVRVPFQKFNRNPLAT